MNPSATIGTLVGEHLTHIDIEEDDPRVTAEVGDDGTVTVLFAEHLRFHRERGLPSGIVDDDGNLTAGGRVRIETCLRLLLAKHGGVDTANVHVDDDFGDEQGFNVALQSKAPTTTLFVDFYSQTDWPFVAAMVNVTDPGTFNVPYLFNHV